MARDGADAQAGVKLVGKERPREYQQELFEAALQRNIVAVLETGTGKTLIAIMLVQAMADEARAAKRKAVFVVPTVDLAHQQAGYIVSATGLSVGIFSGDVSLDYDRSWWDEHSADHEVLVMTAQVLLNLLNAAAVKLDEHVHLLILDECHHARGSDPYAGIMTRWYRATPRERRPRVFGMTASPIGSKGSTYTVTLLKELEELEATLDCQLYTVQVNNNAGSTGWDSVPGTVPLEEFPELAGIQAGASSTSISSASLKRELRPAKEFEEYYEPTPPEAQRRLMGISCELERIRCSFEDRIRGMDSAMVHTLDLVDYYEAQVEDEKKNLRRRVTKRLNQAHTTLQYCLETLGRVPAAIALSMLRHEAATHDLEMYEVDPHMREAFRRIRLAFFQDSLVCQTLNGELPEGLASAESVMELARSGEGLLTPKVAQLAQLVFFLGKEGHQMLVFGERKITVKVLRKLLGKRLECTRSLLGRVGVLVGQEASTSTTRRMRILDAFKKGKMKLLCATSVAEEGLDLTSCKAVLRFDRIQSVRSHIQARGRARLVGSEYYAFVERGNAGDEAWLQSIRSSEAQVAAHLASRTLEPPTRDEAAEGGKGGEYTVASTGASIDARSSVALLYQYFDTLPHDASYSLRPVFRQGDGRISILFPSACPLRVVHGPWGGLRRDACLEAVRQLHLQGELTDQLLPRKRADLSTGADVGPATEKELRGARTFVEFLPRTPLAFAAEGERTALPTGAVVLHGYAILLDLHLPQFGCREAEAGDGEPRGLGLHRSEGKLKQGEAQGSQAQQGAGHSVPQNSPAQGSNAAPHPQGQAEGPGTPGAFLLLLREPMALHVADMEVSLGEAWGGSVRVKSVGKVELCSEQVKALRSFHAVVLASALKRCIPCSVFAADRQTSGAPGAHRMTPAPSEPGQQGSNAASAPEPPVQASVPGGRPLSPEETSWLRDYIIAPLARPQGSSASGSQGKLTSSYFDDGDCIQGLRPASKGRERVEGAKDSAKGPGLIDWDTLDTMSRLWPRCRTMEQVGPTDLPWASLEDAAGMMVLTRHTNQPVLIASVARDLTARSMFPDKAYGTFADYFRLRYKVELQHPHLPLLVASRVHAPFLTKGARVRLLRLDEREPCQPGTGQGHAPTWTAAAEPKDSEADASADSIPQEASSPVVPLSSDRRPGTPQSPGQQGQQEGGEGVQNEELAEGQGQSGTGDGQGPDWSLQYFPAELCLPQAPLSLMLAASALPCIIRHLEALQLAAELRRNLGNAAGISELLCVPLPYVLEAMTAKSCVDEVSLERMETMGDCFLKLALAVQFYRSDPDAAEEQLTRARMAHASNGPLARYALSKNLQVFLRTQSLPMYLPSAPGVAPGGQCLHRQYAPGGPTTGESDSDGSASSDEDDSAEKDEDETPRLQDPVGPTGASSVGLQGATSGAKPPTLAVRERTAEAGMDDPMGEPLCVSKGTGLVGHAGPGEQQVRVSAKVVADFVESLLGCLWLHCGVGPAVAFMRWLGMPCNKIVLQGLHDGPGNAAGAGPLSAPGSDTVQAIGRGRELDGPHVPPKQHRRLAKLQDALGYIFQKEALLLEALTHPSFVPSLDELDGHEDSPAPAVKCYQALEFLGDALVDLLVTQHIFTQYPLQTPRQLTFRRASLVNNENLSRVAAGAPLFLHHFLRHTSHVLISSVLAYVAEAEQLAAKRTRDGAPAEQHEEQEAFFGQGTMAAPKVLGDLLEATCAAVLVDSGFTVRRVWDCVGPLFPIRISAATQSERRHPFSLLSEHCDRHGFKIQKLEAVRLRGQALVQALQEEGEKAEQPLMDQGGSEQAALAALQARDLPKLRTLARPYRSSTPCPRDVQGDEEWTSDDSDSDEESDWSEGGDSEGGG